MILDLQQLSDLMPYIQKAADCLSFALFWMGLYLFFFWLYHTFKVHKRFGIFKVDEPQIHYQTALKNCKIPFIWAIGIYILTQNVGLDLHGHYPKLAFQVPEQLIFIHSSNLTTNIFWGIVGFYLLDLLGYLGHRLNHSHSFLYKKFPVGHFVHHNCVFVNPMVVTSSPLIHFANWSALFVYFLMLSQGLIIPTVVVHIVRSISGWTSHLGCDPLPWLTRLNHKVGGWIPWIPLHHQYHHLPWVSSGDFGNVTCLWDYVFGTVIPECVYHIETGQPIPELAAKMRDQTAIREFLKDKTQLNL